MDARSILATLDHIEKDADGDDIGVLVFDDGQQLNLPLNRLPDGCREGSVINLNMELDQSESDRRRQQIRDIQSRLFGDRSSG